MAELRNRAMVALAVMATVFWMASCDAPDTTAEENGSGSGSGVARVAVELVLGDGAAALEPGPDAYELRIEQGRSCLTRKSTEPRFDIEIEEGVPARLSGTALGEGAVIAEGWADWAPGTAARRIELLPCAGEGSLSIAISWPAEKTRSPSIVAALRKGAATTALDARISGPGTGVAEAEGLAAGDYELELRLDDPGAESVRATAKATILGSSKSSLAVSLGLDDRLAVQPLAAAISGPAGTVFYGRAERFSGAATRADAVLEWFVGSALRGSGEDVVIVPGEGEVISLRARDPFTGETAQASLPAEPRAPIVSGGWINLCRFESAAGLPLRYASACAAFPGGAAVATRGDRGIALCAIDPATGRPAAPAIWRPATVPALEAPAALAYAPGAGTLFVADPGAKALHALDLASRSVLGSFSDAALAGACAIAADAAGTRVYAACDRSSGGDALLVLGFSGGSFSILGAVECAGDSSWRNPKSVELSPDGAWLACCWSTGGRVDIFPVDGATGLLGPPATFHDDPKCAEGTRITTLGGARAARFSDDSSRLVVAAGSDGTLLSFSLGGGTWAPDGWSLACASPIDVAWISCADGSRKLALLSSAAPALRIVSVSGPAFVEDAVFGEADSIGVEGARALAVVDGGRQLWVISGNSKGPGSAQVIERYPRP